jgi:hypothetical protein
VKRMDGTTQEAVLHVSTWTSNIYRAAKNLNPPRIKAIVAVLGGIVFASVFLGLIAAAAISVILLSGDVTLTSAQQQNQLTNQSVSTQNATLFQSTEDSFILQVPEDWIIWDVNNTGSKLIEEATRGYGILAQLCPQQQHQQGFLNVSADSIPDICQRSDEGIIHIIRYPNLDTRLQTAYGVSTNNMTTDNILLYHLQKLQEVGYRGIQIVNSTETAVNVTDAQTNQTIAMAPAKVVEMTYMTNFGPNETRTGYFILTATNATAPNPGMTKGYSIFYENTSAVPAAAATVPTTTTGSPSLAPMPLIAAVAEVFDSFQLIAAPAGVIGQSAAAAQTGQSSSSSSAAQTGQTIQTIQTDCDSSYPDVCIPPPPPDLNCDDPGVPDNIRVLPPDPHGFDGNDNDGIGCESEGGSEQPDDEGGSGGEQTDCDSSYPDVCIPPPPPDLNCDDISERNFEVRSPDPHGFDGDNDGIGCESGGGSNQDDSERTNDDGADDGSGGGTASEDTRTQGREASGPSDDYGSDCDGCDDSSSGSNDNSGSEDSSGDSDSSSEDSSGSNDNSGSEDPSESPTT